MKIITLNTRIWTRDRDKSSEHFWKKRYRAIRDFIRNETPDVVCLQEVLFPADIFLMHGLGYRRIGLMNFTHPILVKKGIRASQHRAGIHYSRAVVCCTQIINVHCRWESWIVKRTMDKLTKLVYNFDHSTVACGDYNVGLATIKKYDTPLYSAREALGIEAQDTFQNYTKAESHGEIDHIMLYGIVPFRYILGGSYMSDHRPITFAF